MSDQAMIERVPIDTIRVGKRRREDLGDIAGLAANIERHGLIHPIIITDDAELIAGERRLRACQSLGWEDVEVRRWRVLSEAERREIELAENLDRKDLTDFERARDLVTLADTAGEADRDELRSVVERNSRGHPEKAGSLRRVAERIGVPVTTIHRAQEHVETATTYPFMQDPSWRQGQVLEAKHQLDRIPEPQREEAAEIINQPYIPPQRAVPILANLAEMPADQRDEVLRLNRSSDERDRDRALTTAANLPAMPDPRVTRIDRATAEVRLAAKAFPLDPFAPRLHEAAALLRGIADDIRKGSIGAHDHGAENIA